MWIKLGRIPAQLSLQEPPQLPLVHPQEVLISGGGAIGSGVVKQSVFGIEQVRQIIVPRAYEKAQIIPFKKRSRCGYQGV